VPCAIASSASTWRRRADSFRDQIQKQDADTAKEFLGNVVQNLQVDFLNIDGMSVKDIDAAPVALVMVRAINEVVK